MNNKNIIIEGKQRANFITMNNGHKLPLVGMGSWQLDNPEELEQAVVKAFEVGYLHFDTATLYRNEALLGNVFRKMLDKGKVKREQLFITTKLPCNGMRPDLVEKFVKASIARLQVNYIDQYLLHWPIGLTYTTDEDMFPMKDGKILYDKKTNLEAVWKAMEAQVDAGRVKSIGISNFNIKQVDRIMRIARIPPSSLQIEIHAYFQNKPLRHVCEKYNISVIAYGSLGSIGRKNLTFPGIEFKIPQLMEDPVVKDIARKHHKTPAQILLKFLVQQNVAVIPKSGNTDRLKMNINIFNFELNQVDMRRLEGLDKGEEGRSFDGFPSMNEHPECPWVVPSKR